MQVMAKKAPKKPAEVAGDDWITRSIRFPPDLYRRLEEEAAKERRSTQLQVIWMIEEAFRLREEGK